MIYLCNKNQQQHLDWLEFVALKENARVNIEKD